MSNHQFKFNKTVAIIALLFFVFSTTTALATEGLVFKDINQSSTYAREAIIELAEKNVIQGNNGNFNPTRTINRGEMITMIVRALELDTEELPETATFKDVTVDHWAFKYVEAAYREGIVKGVSAEEFGQGAEATREQMAVMFIRALGVLQEENRSGIALTHVSTLKDANQVANWAKVEVELALASGLMMGMGENTFAPKGNAKREQMAVIIHRLVTNTDSILGKMEGALKPQEFQHQALYNALVKSQQAYKGEINTTLKLKITDLVTEESISMMMEEISKVNINDVHTISKIAFIVDGVNEEEVMETIVVDGVLFMLDSEEDVWLELGEFPIDINTIDGGFLLNYHNYNITNEGTVKIGEETVTKYTLKVGIDETLSMIPSDYAGFLDLMIDDENVELDEIEYVFEFYVNDEEQIIQVSYAFEMVIEDEEGNPTEMKMSMVVAYKNIGVEYSILAPEDAILVIVDFDDFDWEDFDWDSIDWDDFDLDE